MRLRRPRRLVPPLLAAALTTALAVAVPLTAGGPARADDAAGYTATPLFFTVKVGAGGKQTCRIPADLYLPADAGPANRVPAILTTNGFGGSKNDQAGFGKYFAARGYAVLSYSGLGFGGASCKITLDDPAVDGVAATQLIDYLAGARGAAYTDAARTTLAPALDAVQLDAPGDPRIGMYGMSYGGGIQFATASIDKRLDTIVPMATWNDLSYSLSPNNTDQTTGVSTATPGAAKLMWALGFVFSGVTNGLNNAQDDPGRMLPCPNFADFVCPALITAGLTGAVDASAVKQLRQRSVAGFIDKIDIPTLLVQGQDDTLFNLNEATATFNALRKRGVPTKMIWMKGGHSGPAAPGELTPNPDIEGEYVTARVAAWYDHYLRDRNVDTGPRFSYFRDWVDYDGNAEPAYATSNKFPVGAAGKLYLSGEGLTPQAGKVVKGSQMLVTPPLGLPSSTHPIDALGDLLKLKITDADLPGTTASWTSPALPRPVDVAGTPTLDLTVDAPTAKATQAIDAGKVVLFIRIEDVAPDGTSTIVRHLEAPVRVPDAGKAFRAILPGIVHRFDTGHAVRLVLAGGSLNYRGSLVPTPVTVATGSTGQVLSLPIVP